MNEEKEEGYLSLNQLIICSQLHTIKNVQQALYE